MRIRNLRLPADGVQPLHEAHVAGGPQAAPHPGPVGCGVERREHLQPHTLPQTLLPSEHWAAAKPRVLLARLGGQRAVVDSSQRSRVNTFSKLSEDDVEEDECGSSRKARRGNEAYLSPGAEHLGALCREGRQQRAQERLRTIDLFHNHAL